MAALDPALSEAKGRRTWHFEIRSSEAKPRLELDHPAGKSGIGLAERSPVKVGGVGVEQERLRVELVEGVEEVGANLDFGRFAEIFQVGEAESLGQTQIIPPVARTAEGVAANRGRERVREVRVADKVVRAAAGEV